MICVAFVLEVHSVFKLVVSISTIQVLYSLSINDKIENNGGYSETAVVSYYYKEGVQHMLLIETIFTSFACLYFWVVFRTSRPPSAPSLAATRR